MNWAGLSVNAERQVSGGEIGNWPAIVADDHKIDGNRLHASVINRRLEARLTEEPTRGRANRQLVEELAEILSVPAAAIEVMSGHKNSRKVVLVRGMAADQVISILSSKIK